MLSVTIDPFITFFENLLVRNGKTNENDGTLEVAVHRTDQVFPFISSSDQYNSLLL